MAKKGTFSFDSDDDIEFSGGEMFELPDDAFDDAGMDFLEGFNDDGPKEKSGVGGFFSNAIKSVKGLGLDIVNEFLPATIDMKDTVGSSLNEMKSMASEKIDLAASKISDLRAKNDNKKIMGIVGDTFKETLGNIKKGKFYKSDLDMSDFSMDDFLSDDDEDEDDEDRESEDVDTSGILTTAYTPKKSIKPVKVMVATDSSNTIAAMEAIQENSVTATAKISTRLSNKQNAILQQNFTVQRAYLANISTNLQNVVGFLANEGVTSLRAQLEYSAKTLAFMTDRNNLMKEQIKLMNRSLGIDFDKMKMEEERRNEMDRENTNPFSGGFFDLDKYGKGVINNVKDMFMGSTLGFGIDSMMQMNEMSKGMGKMMSPAKMMKSMVKGTLFNQLFSEKTKAVFDRINTGFEAIPAMLANRFTGFKGSDNSVLSFLGEILGVNRVKDVAVDMGMKDPLAPVAFDNETKFTITREIPGWLSKIHAALTGGKQDYYDKTSGVFKTVESKKKEYEMLQENIIAGDFEMSKKLDLVKNDISSSGNRFANQVYTMYELDKDGKYKQDEHGNRIIKKDKDGNDMVIKTDPAKFEKQRDEAFKLFQKNLVQSNGLLEIGSLMQAQQMMNQGKDIEDTLAGSFYAKLFRGFKNKFGDNEYALKNMVISSILDINDKDPTFLNTINMRLPHVANSLEKEMKQFKQNSLTWGGADILSSINVEEKISEMQHQIENSSHYNYNGDNKIKKANAVVAKTNAERSMYTIKGGIVKIDDEEHIEDSTNKYIGKIYDALIAGIPVFNLDDDAASKRASELGVIIESRKAKEEAKKDAEEKKIKDESEALKNLANAVRESAKYQTAMRMGQTTLDGGLLESLRNAAGLDALANAVNRSLVSVLGKVTGNEEYWSSMFKNTSLSDSEIANARSEFGEQSQNTINSLKEKAASYNDIDLSERKGFGKFTSAVQKGVGKAVTNVQIVAQKAASGLNQKGLKTVESINKMTDNISKMYNEGMEAIFSLNPEFFGSIFENLNSDKTIGMEVYVEGLEHKPMLNMLLNKLNKDLSGWRIKFVGQVTPTTNVAFGPVSNKDIELTGGKLVLMDSLNDNSSLKDIEKAFKQLKDVNFIKKNIINNFKMEDERSKGGNVDSILGRQDRSTEIFKESYERSKRQVENIKSKNGKYDSYKKETDEIDSNYKKMKEKRKGASERLSNLKSRLESSKFKTRKIRDKDGNVISEEAIETREDLEKIIKSTEEELSGYDKEFNKWDAKRSSSDYAEKKKEVQRVNAILKETERDMRTAERDYRTSAKRSMGQMYPNLSKIKTPKDAINIFMKNNPVSEVDSFLRNASELEIMEFVRRMRSEKEYDKLTQGRNIDINDLDPILRDRISAMRGDAKFSGKEIVRETLRSPLKQFALYSVGRAPTAVTNKLFELAGMRTIRSYYGNKIGNKIIEEGKTVADTLKSDHLIGKAVDFDLNINGIKPKTIVDLGKEYGLRQVSTSDPSHFTIGNISNKGKFVGNSAILAKTEDELKKINSMVERRNSRDTSDNISTYFADTPKMEDSALVKNASTTYSVNDNMESGKNNPFRNNKPLFMIHNRLIEMRSYLHDLVNNTTHIGIGLGIPGSLKGVLDTKTPKGIVEFLSKTKNRVSGFVKDTLKKPGDKEKEDEEEKKESKYFLSGIFDKLKSVKSDISDSVFGKELSKMTDEELKTRLMVNTGMSFEEVDKMSREEVIKALGGDKKRILDSFKSFDISDKISKFSDTVSSKIEEFGGKFTGIKQKAKDKLNIADEISNFQAKTKSKKKELSEFLAKKLKINLDDEDLQRLKSNMHFDTFKTYLISKYGSKESSSDDQEGDQQEFEDKSIVGTFKRTFSGVKSSFTSAFANAKDFSNMKKEEVLEYLKEKGEDVEALKDKSEEELKTLASNIQSQGGGIAVKIGSTVKSVGSKVAATAGNIAAGGLSLFNRAPQYGKQILGELRAIRVMLNGKFGPVNIEAIMNDIKPDEGKGGSGGGKLGGILKGVGKAVKGVASFAWDKAKKLGKAGLGAAGALLGGAKDLLGKGFSFAKDTLLPGAARMTRNVAKFAITKALPTAIRGAGALASGGLKLARMAGRGAIAAGKAGLAVGGMMLRGVKDIVKFFAQAGFKLVGNAKDFIVNGILGVIDIIKKKKDVIKAGHELKKVTKQLRKTGYNDDSIEVVYDVYRSEAAQQGIPDDQIEKVIQYAEGKGVISKADSVVTGTKDAVTALPGNVKDLAGKAKDKAVDAAGAVKGKTSAVINKIKGNYAEWSEKDLKKKLIKDYGFTEEELANASKEDMVELLDGEKGDIRGKIEKAGRVVGTGIGKVGKLPVKGVGALATGALTFGGNIINGITGKNVTGFLGSKAELARDALNDRFSAIRENGIHLPFFGGKKRAGENERGQIEGSYKDQVTDKKEADAIQRDVDKTEVLKDIAAFLGIKKYKKDGDDTIMDMLREIDENGENTIDGLKKVERKAGSGGGNGGGSGGRLKNLAKTALGTGAGIAAGAVTVGAGVAMIAAPAIAAGTAIKRKVASVGDRWKHAEETGFIGHAKALLGSADQAENYNEDGTKKTDEEMKNSRAKVNAGSVIAGATVASKAPTVMKLLQKLFMTVFSKGPVKKLLGKNGHKAFIKWFFKIMKSRLSKGIGKIGAKIASFVAKGSNPVGWGIMIAQAVAAVVNGWNNTKRYFSLGKGIQPTIPMRITSALVSLVSDFAFGLIPVKEAVTAIFDLTASDSTKAAMESGKAFVAKRAKILGVENDRLVEYESQTLKERIFGSDSKWAKVLGFAKGNKDKAGVNIFKRWKKDKYKPLDDMMNDMAKQYGKKVLKTCVSEEDIKLQEKFRAEYLKAAETYVKQHGLEWLKAGAVEGDESKQAENEKTKIEGDSEEAEQDSEEAEVTAATDPEATKGAEAMEAGAAATVDSITDAEKPDVAPGTAKPSFGEKAKGFLGKVGKGMLMATPVGGAIMLGKKLFGKKKRTDSDYLQNQADNIENGPNIPDDKAMKSDSLVKSEQKRGGLFGKLAAGFKMINSLHKKIEQNGGVFNTAKDAIKNGFVNAVNGVKDFGKKVWGAVTGSSVGSKLIATVKDRASAALEFFNNRKASEQAVNSAIAAGDKDRLIDLIHRVKDPKMVGQQKTVEGLAPEFRRRVEQFLADPRIAGRGVSIREGVRPVTSQLAYYLKGRAPNEVTDLAMKEAGFKYGINFWGKNFQKPGDTVTQTLASNHFLGTAVDLEPGTVGYQELGKIAKEYGIDWGGYWKWPDPPHFEMFKNFSGKIPDNSVYTKAGTEAGNMQADNNVDTVYDHVSSTAATSLTLNQNVKNTGSVVSSARSSNLKPITSSMIRSAGQMISSSAASRLGSTSVSARQSVGHTAKMVSKVDGFDRILQEGISIMEELLNEEKRHNKVNEKQLGEILTGIAALGKIMTAGVANMGGTQGGSDANVSLTNSLFDKLAKGM